MDCQGCRDAVSARLDGEDPGEDPDAHLAGCAACRAMADRMAEVTRRVRLRAVEPAPDLVDRVLTSTTTRAPRSAPGCRCVASCGCGCQQGRSCRCGEQVA